MSSEQGLAAFTAGTSRLGRPSGARRQPHGHLFYSEKAESVADKRRIAGTPHAAHPRLGLPVGGRWPFLHILGVGSPVGREGWVSPAPRPPHGSLVSKGTGHGARGSGLRHSSPNRANLLGIPAETPSSPKQEPAPAALNRQTERSGGRSGGLLPSDRVGVYHGPRWRCQICLPRPGTGTELGKSPLFR